MYRKYSIAVNQVGTAGFFRNNFFFFGPAMATSSWEKFLALYLIRQIAILSHTSDSYQTATFFFYLRVKHFQLLHYSLDNCTRLPKVS